MLGTLGSLLVQVAATVALGRLLGPAEYGLLAVANVVISFGGYFAQMGLGAAVVQAPSLDRQDIRAFFTLSAGLGLAFAALAALAAPLAAQGFHSPAATDVIRWLCLSFVLSGLSLTSTSLLRRDLRFGVLALIEGGSLLGGGLASVACALAGWGVWSLVTGVLTQQAIVAAASFLAARHSVTPLASIRAWKKCLSFGTRYSLNSILDFVYANMDVVILGRAFSSRWVGLYNRSGTLANMPVQYVFASVSRVMFPVFSRLFREGGGEGASPAPLTNDRRRLAHAFVTTFALAGLCCGAVSCGMVSAAKEIILLALGDRWLDAVFPFQVLCLVLLMQFLMSLQGMVMDSMGKLRERARMRGLGVVAKMAALSVAVPFGVEAFLASLLAAQVCQQAIYFPFVTRALGLSARKFMALYAGIALFGALVGGAAWMGAIPFQRAILPVPIVLAARVGCGGIAFAAACALVVRWGLFGIGMDTVRSFPFLARFRKKESYAL